jgi:CRP-like cAMP-binding protein
MTDLSKHEEMVDKLVEENRREEAVKLLFKLIVQHAKAKNFVKAEALREKLFEVDSMALTEIIKSAELIEEEKSEALDPNHRDLFASLYATLDTEEANTFFFSLQTLDLDSDEPVFEQGQKNKRLFFVNHGQLKLFYSQDGTEKLIATLGPGDLAGQDTFFSISVCTTSLAALTPTRLLYLDPEVFSDWQENNPTLASKIEAYCAKVPKPHDLLRKKGQDRRRFRRIKLYGPVLFQVLNRSGKPIGKPYKGDLSDVSEGGLSFFIKTANRSNALALLGRRLRLKFALPLGKRKIESTQEGMITGVISHLFSDYSIHMSFDKPLSKNLIRELEHAPPQREPGTFKAERDVP